MENLQDLFKNAVNDSVEKTSEILAARAEDGAGVDHAVFEMQEQLEEANKKLKELENLRNDFDNYRTEYAAYKAAEEHRTKIAERNGAFKGIISTLFVTIIGGLVVSYWPDIIQALSRIPEFFVSVFHCCSSS